MRKNSKISNVHTVAKSNIFRVESMGVEFSNGEIRTYERLNPKGKIDAGETPIEAADRELKEEIGYGA